MGMDSSPLPKAFWKSIFSASNEETYKALFGEQLGRIMIAALLFCIYVTLLWTFSSHDMATGELVLKCAATAAPLALYPFILAINFARTTKKAYSDLYGAHQNLVASLEELPKLEIFLLQEGKQTLCRVTNVGTGAASLNAEIDYSEANLGGDSPRNHVGARWLDGYAGSLRVLEEKTRNEFLIRDIEGHFERFYGCIGIQHGFWDGHGIETRRITIVVNATPRPPGGSNQIIFETSREKIVLISGDAKIRGG